MCKLKGSVTIFVLGILLFGCAAQRKQDSAIFSEANRPSATAERDKPEKGLDSAGARAAGQARAGAGLYAEPGAAGTWDWVLRSTTQQGDLHIEQEEWHLQQQGARIFGYYNRQVVTLSSDQRPYRCNGMLGFVNNTLVRVVGEVHGREVSLREVGFDAEKNPCDDGARNLTSYIGSLAGHSLLLRYPSGGGQHLVRRQESSPMLAIRPESEAQSPQEDLSQVALEGVWDWQFRAADPDGDLHLEKEEWHLHEENSEISGYYERTLERRRASGVFACNGNSTIHNITRYLVKGQRFGSKLTLTEVDYQTQAGPCENRARRLDSYRGTLLPNGQMVLGWAGGQQILYKRALGASPANHSADSPRSE